jgi:hypothetical protein
MLKLCVIIILISCIQAFGQRQLVLIKGNTVITRFSEGDHIRFRRNDTDYIFNGIITGISQEYFKLGDEDTTYLNQIKSIDLRGLPNSGFKTADMGGKFIAAGAVLLLIDALNTANGNKISTGVVLVSSSFIVVGSAMLIFNNNYFKPGRKKRVIIMG